MLGLSVPDSPRTTRGFELYSERFRDRADAFAAFDKLPWQLCPLTTDPEAISGDEDLSPVFARCAERGEPITANEIVDTLHLVDGVYEFMGVRMKSRTAFVKAVRKLKFFV